MTSIISSRTGKNTNSYFEGIVVTHAINPHMFWFRPDVSYLFKNEDSNKLEMLMLEYFHLKSKEYSENGYIPKINEV